MAALLATVLLAWCTAAAASSFLGAAVPPASTADILNPITGYGNSSTSLNVVNTKLNALNGYTLNVAVRCGARWAEGARQCP
jgi:hypothetical protein